MRFRLLIAAGALAVVAGIGIAAYVLAGPSPPPRAVDATSGNANRGAYVARLAGCIACHTNMKEGGALLAGGPPIKTPFGTFYGPNITLDPEDGIGEWTLGDFAAALTHGRSPKGKPYYPVFPYTSYTRLSDQDLADLWAAVQTVQTSRGRPPKHDIAFPFSIRSSLIAWQRLFLDATPFKARADHSDAWNRGAYIVTGPGHCVACHTPRNILGARDESLSLAGSQTGPGGEKIPAITAGALQKRGWTKGDIAFALRMGLKPDGDTLSGSMGEVVRHGTAWLSDEDLSAIAEYLMTENGDR